MAWLARVVEGCCAANVHACMAGCGASVGRGGLWVWLFDVESGLADLGRARHVRGVGVV